MCDISISIIRDKLGSLDSDTNGLLEDLRDLQKNGGEVEEDIARIIEYITDIHATVCAVDNVDAVWLQNLESLEDNELRTIAKKICIKNIRNGFNEIEETFRKMKTILPEISISDERIYNSLVKWIERES